MTGGARAMAARCGDFFFRWRSYLPLTLAPLVALAVARSQLALTSRDDLLWEVGCVLLALGGLALRAWAVGVAAPGTSGRNTREQKAATLNTTGPYSLVRHPLYIANSIIALGLALFPHAWTVPPLVATLATAYYACIAEREDQFLRERFGVAWMEWAARVPRAIPAFGQWQPAAQPFQWRVMLRREFYGLTLILVAPLIFDVAEDFYETGAFDLDPVWAVTAALGSVLFVVMRYLKKRTSVLAVRRPSPSQRADAGTRRSTRAPGP